MPAEVATIQEDAEAVELPKQLRDARVRGLPVVDVPGDVSYSSP